MQKENREEWWFGEDSKFSLKNYRDMPVYHRFVKCSRPYTLDKSFYREAFWKDDNCLIFEWYDSKEQKGEKFGIDYNSNTRFYEHWYTQDDVHIIEKYWLRTPVEWGVIIKYSPEYEEEITWNSENRLKTIETRTKKDGRTDVLKKGQKFTPDGPEDFTEIFWETPTGSGKEKVWACGTANGSEKEFKDGEKKWGEIWTNDVNKELKQEWHEEGSRRWGTKECTEGYGSWKEKWEKNSQSSIEEIDCLDREFKWGKARYRSSSNSFNVNWTGKKPEVDMEDYREKNLKNDEEKGKISNMIKKHAKQKLRSGRSAGPKVIKGKELKNDHGSNIEYNTKKDDQEEDETELGDSLNKSDSRKKSRDAEKFEFQLSTLFNNLKEDFLNRLEDLKSQDFFNSKYKDLQSMSKRAKKIVNPSPSNPQESMTSIGKLRKLIKKLENLENSLFDSFIPIEQTKKIFEESISSCAALQPILDPLNLSNIRRELQSLSREFNLMENPKDQLKLISTINPLIFSMIQANKKSAETSPKETSEIDQNLSDSLQELCESINQSQQTLQEIKKIFKPDEEIANTLLQDYADRSKDIFDYIKGPVSYSEVIPEISSLLIEMEKFKRETIEENLKKISGELQGQEDSNTKEIQELRKVNSDHEAKIMELRGILEQNPLSNKEKLEILDILQNKNKRLNDRLNSKIEDNEELEEKNAIQEQSFMRLESEKDLLEKELEKTINEKQQLKDEGAKLLAENRELQEKIKAIKSSNPAELDYLEKILGDKKKEIQDIESNFASEKQGLEDNLKQALVDLEDFKTKYNDLAKKYEEINVQVYFKVKYKNLMNEYEDIKNQVIFKIKYNNLVKNYEEVKIKVDKKDGLEENENSEIEDNQKIEAEITFLKNPGAFEENTQAAERLLEEIQEKNSLIEELNDQIEKLENTVLDYKKKYEVFMSRSFLVRIYHAFKDTEGQGFRKWRAFKKEVFSILNSPKEKNSFIIEIDDEDKQNESYYKTADETISEELSTVLEPKKATSPYKSELKSEKPMSHTSIIKFLEDLMDKKFEADIKDAKNCKDLSNMPDFMMETILSTFGIQSLALKFLSHLVSGLYELYKDGHTYVVFFARILQIFHPDPVSFALSVFLVKVWMDFSPLAEACERSFNEGEIKNASMSQYEFLNNGGEAKISGVIDLIYNLFKDDREGGEKALELIKPAKVSFEDYISYKICHKIAKMRKTPETVFLSLDKNQSGTIDINELAVGLRNDLDLWISNRNIVKLLEHLDVSQNSEITAESFTEKINMEFFVKCNKSSVWTTSKAGFLTSLIEIYKYKQRKMLAKLYKNFEEKGNNIEKESFAKIILEYDPNASEEIINKLYEEAQIPGKTVSLKSIGIVICKYGFGDLKAFKVKEIDKELKRRELEGESKCVKRKLSVSMEEDAKVERDEEAKVVVRKKVVKKLKKRAK